MTTTSTSASEREVAHTSWCTDHVPPSETYGAESDGWCRRTFLQLSWSNGQDRAVVVMEDDGGIVLDVFADLNTIDPSGRLSATEAREMGTALLLAADEMEALQAS